MLGYCLPRPTIPLEATQQHHHQNKMVIFVSLLINPLDLGLVLFQKATTFSPLIELNHIGIPFDKKTIILFGNSLLLRGTHKALYFMVNITPVN
jgi:hypothetical protein